MDKLLRTEGLQIFAIDPGKSVGIAAFPQLKTATVTNFYEWLKVLSKDVDHAYPGEFILVVENYISYKRFKNHQQDAIAYGQIGALKFFSHMYKPVRLIFQEPAMKRSVVKFHLKWKPLKGTHERDAAKHMEVFLSSDEYV